MSDYTDDLAYAARMDDDIVTAGQPTAAQLEAAARGGVKTVVNLRPVGEFHEYDEAALVDEAGMTYVHIPVASPDDINDATARQLDEALADGTPALAHSSPTARATCRARARTKPWRSGWPRG